MKFPNFESTKHQSGCLDLITLRLNSSKIVISSITSHLIDPTTNLMISIESIQLPNKLAGGKLEVSSTHKRGFHPSIDEVNDQKKNNKGERKT